MACTDHDEHVRQLLFVLGSRYDHVENELRLQTTKIAARCSKSVRPMPASSAWSMWFQLALVDSSCRCNNCSDAQELSVDYRPTR